MPLLLIAKAVADKRFLLKAGLLVHYSGLGRALLFFIKQARVALGLAFLLHYTYRALAFPLLIRGGKPTPLVVWAMALAFCLWNGFLQGWFLSQQMKATLPVTHPRVAAGLAIWLFGFLNVLRADAILRSLRKHGESGYKVPHGGMFEYVSAGNYGAEIIEWAGYALAAGSLAPAAFAFFTFCNLAPRGHAHHQWYKRKFEEYPKSRRAVIPFLW